MKISKLDITNFRGVKEASLYFEGHTLLVGRNNIGKSTICESLDLVLGPDRINRASAIDEYDFYNGLYLNEDEESIEIKIEVVLIDISDELKSVFRSYIEFWHTGRQEILSEGDIDVADEEIVEECLRITFIGKYDPEEDEFVAKTYYSHSFDEEEGVFLDEISKSKKRMIGFLYLRALRTGSRALSLERGTLLDILLRVGEIRPKFWEETREKLQNLNPPLDDSIGSLRKVLDNIEQRVGQYIPLPNNHKATTLHVSQLTREHLRKTLSFFMSSSANQMPIPFQKLGTGTLSTLVFALLSAIAELKKENIIFAMEEPEISIPPHTQRRIIDYLIKNTTQSFVTSHSPYVIEKFDPEQIKILTKNDDAVMIGKNINLSGLKPKNYRRKIRHAIAEVILGNAVIVGEGLTELEVLNSSARILEQDLTNYPIDLSGVTIFDSGGDGSVVEYGNFFKSIGLKTYAFFDYMVRTQDQKNALNDAFDYYTEITQTGIEKLLIAEVPILIQWRFLNELKDSGEFSSGPHLPDEQPSDDNVQKFTLEALKQKKGERRASYLIEMCRIEELPPTIVSFFEVIYNDFKQPENVKAIDFSETVVNSEEE
jgi:putative ATP-dependent endonuclease of OLD family